MVVLICPIVRLMFNFTIARRLFSAAPRAWGGHTRDVQVMFYKHTFIYDIPVYSESSEMGPLISITYGKEKIALSFERIVNPAHPPIPVDSEPEDSPDSALR